MNEALIVCACCGKPIEVGPLGRVDERDAGLGWMVIVCECAMCKGICEWLLTEDGHLHFRGIVLWGYFPMRWMISIE